MPWSLIFMIILVFAVFVIATFFLPIKKNGGYPVQQDGDKMEPRGIRSDQGSQDYVYQTGDEEEVCIGCGRPGPSLCRGCASNWFR